MSYHYTKLPLWQTNKWQCKLCNAVVTFVVPCNDGSTSVTATEVWETSDTESDCSFLNPMISSRHLHTQHSCLPHNHGNSWQHMQFHSTPYISSWDADNTSQSFLQWSPPTQPLLNMSLSFISVMYFILTISFNFSHVIDRSGYLPSQNLNSMDVRMQLTWLCQIPIRQVEWEIRGNQCQLTGLTQHTLPML